MTDVNRISSLDYLRGVCAIFIMIYHFLAFSDLVEFDSGDFRGRMSIYGVSVFYILSGLTLYLVYHNRFQAIDFYIKRVFRIFPLLWVAITLTVLVLGGKFTWHMVLWVYTGLFGFFRWWDYVATGAWSIGNELFFYFVFPLFLEPSKKLKYWPIVVGVPIYSVFLWYTFVKLSPTEAFVSQWRAYINPLNQVGLFFTGFLIGFYFNDVKINQRFAIVALLILVLIFTFYPTEGNFIMLVTGLNRLILTGISALIVFLFFKIDLRVGVIDPILKLMGEASYSIYLLHPIVWFTVPKLMNTDPIYHVVACTIISITLSVAVYKWFERPFMRLGRTLTKKALAFMQYDDKKTEKAR